MNIQRPVYGKESLASTVLPQPQAKSDDKGSLSSQVSTTPDQAIQALLERASGGADWEAAELLVNLAAGLGTEQQTRLAGAALVELSRNLDTPAELRDAIASFCVRVVEQIQKPFPKTEGEQPKPWQPQKLSPELLYVAAQELQKTGRSDGDLAKIQDWIAATVSIEAVVSAQGAKAPNAPQAVAKEALKPDRYVTLDEFQPALKDSGLPSSGDGHPRTATSAKQIKEAVLESFDQLAPVPIMVNQRGHWVLLVACKDQTGALACIAFDSLLDARDRQDADRRENFLATALREVVPHGNFKYVNPSLQNLHPGAGPAPLDNACGPLCALALRGISGPLKAPGSDKTFQAIDRHLTDWLRQWESLGEDQQTRIVVAERAGMLASFRASEPGG